MHVDIVVTQPGIRISYLSLGRVHPDFFPPECYGTKRRRGARLSLEVEGIREPVLTDIDPAGRFFRNRRWSRRFFREQGLRAGDVVRIERVGSSSYRIYRQPEQGGSKTA